MDEGKLIGGRTEVYRKGDHVLRATGPWTSAVHAVLRHLEAKNFPASRLIGNGYNAAGQEVLTFIEGDFIHPYPWTEPALIELSRMLRQLHTATSDFVIPPNTIWHHWHGRLLPGTRPVISHCDLGQWNIIARNNIPYAFIDWDTVGPTDELTALAQFCWFNIQFMDDDLAEKLGLSDASTRCKQMKLVLDAYGLEQSVRSALVERMIELAVLDAAEQAIEGKITEENLDVKYLWGLAWRTRSAAWMLRYKDLLLKSVA